MIRFLQVWRGSKALDRKLILFFVLVALTMWISQKLIYSKYPRTPVQQGREEVSETPPSGEMPESPLASPYIVQEEPPEGVHEQVAEKSSYEELIPGFVPAEEKIVTITTGQLELELASRGGTLSSWRLPEYKRKDGTVVSLFPQDYAGALSLVVQRGGKEYSLSDLPFAMEVNRSPGEGFAASVRWTARGNQGAWIRKELKIPEEGYICRFSVESGGMGLAGFTTVWPAGLVSTEENEKDDKSFFALMAGTTGNAWKKNLKKIRPEAPERREGPLDWAGIRTKYFLAAMVPDSLSWHRVTSLGGSDQGSIGMAIQSLAPGGSIKEGYALFLGPVDYDLVAPLGRGVTNAVEMGNKYLRPIGRVILLFFTKVHGVIPNFGIVIILFAITIKIILHPFTRKSMQSMKKMQELQPKLAEIKEKYKKNQQKQQEETMKMYREHGVNPLGGCLPLVFQMPIFFAMFPILKSSIYLRGAMFIPGFVSDLSQPSPILPILMGITQFFSSKMMATPNQNKMMLYGMPLFFTYMFFRFPAGLVLYWLVFNLLQIAQQMWQKRSVQKSGQG